MDLEPDGHGEEKIHDKVVDEPELGHGDPASNDLDQGAEILDDEASNPVGGQVEVPAPLHGHATANPAQDGQQEKEDKQGVGEHVQDEPVNGPIHDTHQAALPATHTFYTLFQNKNFDHFLSKNTNLCTNFDFLDNVQAAPMNLQIFV